METLFLDDLAVSDGALRTGFRAMRATLRVVSAVGFTRVTPPGILQALSDCSQLTELYVDPNVCTAHTLSALTTHCKVLRVLKVMGVPFAQLNLASNSLTSYAVSLSSLRHKLFHLSLISYGSSVSGLICHPQTLKTACNL
jgi:hypothetical protein